MSMTLHLVDTVELLERARSVREKVFTIEKQIPKSIEVDELDCLNNECDHFVVELIDEQVKKNGACGRVDICALRCKKIDDKCIQLQRFCVMKDYRKCGVGRFTLEQVEDYYWKRGFELITLDAKFHVKDFYEKCGYRVVSEPFMEADLLHVVMEKRRT